MNSRAELGRLRDAVRERIGRRRLVYYGIRGSDADALGDFDQLSHVISLTDAFAVRSGVRVTTAEASAGLRIDLDAEIDLTALADETIAEALSASLDKPALLLPYRPTPQVSQAVLRAGGSCTYLGMFDRPQSAFEYKPWIDRELSALGIPTLGWQMISRDDRDLVIAMLRVGSVVARLSVSSGGAGISRVGTIEEFDAFLSSTGARAVSVARYHEHATPLNIGGVVWAGGVTLHPLSLQLIGIDPLVDRTFGYCGNDYGAARELPRDLFDTVSMQTERIGEWLRTRGYRGAFGVDYLADGGDLLFCEVNPRFQGSSRLSDRVSREVGRPGLVLEHMAAFLGVPPTATQQPLYDLAQEIPPLAHAVLHRRGPDARVDVASALKSSGRTGVLDAVEVICPPSLICARNAVTLRAVFASRVTSTGYALLPEARKTIERIAARLNDSDAVRLQV